MKIVLDTSVVIDHLRNVPQASRVLRHVENGSFEGLLSALTVMELLAVPVPAEEGRQALESLWSIFQIVPAGSRVAAVAGRYLADYRVAHGLAPVDSLIAATAALNDAALFTLNIDRYRFIEGLVVVNPYVY